MGLVPSPDSGVCSKEGSAFASGTATTPCSKATVGGSARCCATNDWPSAGGCLCTSATPNCHKSTDGKFCFCGLAQPGPGEPTVSSCTGTFCCQSRSNAAPMCTCYTNTTLSSCESDEVKVPSCGAASLECEGRAVDTCR